MQRRGATALTDQKRSSVRPDGALLVREPGLANDTALQAGSMIFEESV